VQVTGNLGLKNSLEQSTPSTQPPALTGWIL